jgi:hypothetical protein
VPAAAAAIVEPFGDGSTRRATYGAIPSAAGESDQGRSGLTPLRRTASTASFRAAKRSGTGGGKRVRDDGYAAPGRHGDRRCEGEDVDDDEASRRLPKKCRTGRSPFEADPRVALEELVVPPFLNHALDPSTLLLEPGGQFGPYPTTRKVGLSPGPMGIEQESELARRRAGIVGDEEGSTHPPSHASC